MGEDKVNSTEFEKVGRVRSALFSFLSSLRSKPEGLSFSFLRLVAIPIGVIVLFTILIRISGLDLALQEHIYEAGEQSWELGKRPFWKFLYDFGAVPALVAVVASVVGVIVGG